MCWRKRAARGWETFPTVGAMFGPNRSRGTQSLSKYASHKDTGSSCMTGSPMTPTPKKGLTRPSETYPRYGSRGLPLTVHLHQRKRNLYGSSAGENLPCRNSGGGRHALLHVACQVRHDAQHPLDQDPLAAVVHLLCLAARPLLLGHDAPHKLRKVESF